MIGPENSHHLLNKSDPKLNSIITLFRAQAYFYLKFLLVNYRVNLLLVVVISLVSLFQNIETFVVYLFIYLFIHIFVCVYSNDVLVEPKDC